MNISIVVLNWNGKKDSLDCLKSIDRLRHGDNQISTILVDNGSTDNSIESFNQLKTPVFKLIKNEKNLGFAAGNNVGIKDALEGNTDWILLLNNDTLVDRNLIINLVKSIKSNKIGIISPKIYFAQGYEFHKDKYPKGVLGKVIWSAGGKMDWNNVFGVNIGVDDVDRGQYEIEFETDFATGACMFIKREVFEKIGFLDERYFMYFEDADFCQRVVMAGYKIIYSPVSVIWHKVSQGSGIGSNLNDYFISRNRMLFGMKYACLRTKLALIKESLKILISGRKWQKIGIRDFFLQIYNKGSYNS